MSGKTFDAWRSGSEIHVSIYSRGGRATAEKAARTLLRSGELMGYGASHDGSGKEWVFKTTPPQVMSLAEVKNGTGFTPGTRFVVIPPGAGL